MRDHFPSSPEDYERQRRRLDALRPWVQAVAVLLGIFLLIALAMQFARLG